MARFTVPRDIYFGRGSLETLKSVEGKRAIVVVGGSSMQKHGFLDRTVGYLKEAGMAVEVFEGVEPDPSVETVMKGAEAMRRFEPDWIVSIGGGSPIDAAKAMWAFYEYPDVTFESLTIPFNFPKLRQKAGFIAIPSTSGTATEVTAFSVITDYAKGIKYPLADFNITPDIAIVDPDVADTMPPALTAFTGMDALTHAHEAYVSTLNCAFTDPLALQAIKTVFACLPAAFKGDKAAREEMHYAQCLAGMAFSNALLGIVHSMAHKTGAAFSTGHIPHGEANAMFLPFVIQYNMKDPTAKARYADIARFVGEPGDTEDALIASLIAHIRALNVQFGIPATLKEFGILEEEFKEKIAAISENAVGDACTGSNPRSIDPALMERLFTCIYYGTDVDF
jgi:alcohol dehydrogenase class IV